MRQKCFKASFLDLWWTTLPSLAHLLINVNVKCLLNDFAYIWSLVARWKALIYDCRNFSQFLLTFIESPKSWLMHLQVLNHAVVGTGLWSYLNGRNMFWFLLHLVFKYPKNLLSKQRVTFMISSSNPHWFQRSCSFAMYGFKFLAVLLFTLRVYFQTVQKSLQCQSIEIMQSYILIRWLEIINFGGCFFIVV